MIADVVVQHAENGSSFVVRNIVKDLVNFILMRDWYLDGVRVLQTIEFDGSGPHVGDELHPDFVLGEEMVDAKCLNERCVTLFKPQMSPPFLHPFKFILVRVSKFINEFFIYQGD